MSITITDEYGAKMPSVEYIVKNFSFDEIERTYEKYKTWLFIAAAASFLASAMSVVKYMAGGSLAPLSWTGEQTISAVIGVLLVALVVAGETFLFSSGYRGWIMITFSAVFIFFGGFTEISQAMERESEGVSIRSQASPAYQAAIKSIGDLSRQAQRPVSNPYALQISEQAQVVARCESRVKEGKEKHCKGDTAKLNALKEQANAAMSATSAASFSALQTTLSTAKQWENDEEQHYAMIKLLKHYFNVTAIQATFFFTFIIIATFRVSFFWIGDQTAAYRQALERLRPDTLGRNNQDAKPKPQDAKSKLNNTLDAKSEYDEVPLSEVVRLSMLNILCDMADGRLSTFSVRDVTAALKRHGYGKTNEFREKELYPALLDEADAEGYVILNPDWIEPKDGEPNRNGKRQKWLIDTERCKEKAELIPRD